MQQPVLCCPTPLRNGLLPHQIPVTPTPVVVPGNTQAVTLCAPDGTQLLVQVNTTTNPLTIVSAVELSGKPYTGDLTALVNCASLIPEPPPVELEGQDCFGDAVPVTGDAGQLTAVVQAPGTVFQVKLCSEDADFELSCGVDPATDHQIQTAYKIVGGDFVLIKRWDTVTGLEWTGDAATLEGCGGKPLEAEQELFCDNGTEFLRWYVIEAGLPTGQTVDTTLAGAAYTVTNPATVKRGACVPAVVCTPTISSAPADTLTGLLPGHSVSVQKNNCCSIKVTTSAGYFIVAKEVTGYSTGNFDCPVTVTGVTVLSGTCSLAEVIVTTQSKG